MVVNNLSPEPAIQQTSLLSQALKGSVSVLMLDGAMGTELLRRNVPTPLPLWSAPANVNHQAVVRQIHRDYVRAGCQLLTTNTFRTSRYAMERSGKADQWEHWNRAAVMHAVSAAADDAWVVGSITTLEDCYRPDLVPEASTARRYHRLQADLLVRLGVDGLLLETFNTLPELEWAFAQSRRHSVPVIASVIPGDGRHLYDGTSLLHVARWANRERPDVLALNCASPEVLDAALRFFADRVDLPLGVYGNVGEPQGEMGFEFTHACSLSAYATWVARWAARGVRVIGGCCGTTPAYMDSAKIAARQSVRVI